MRVLVTGATGFVGARIVADLVGAGHEVRLLVRRPEQVPVSMAPHDVPADRLTDVVQGDVLDPDAVEKAVTDRDAVVHAAAVFSLDSRRYAEIRRTNERAAEVVLDSACRAGLDPVVHVSSTVALMRHGGSDRSLPLGDIEMAYAQSKLASERVARRLQDAGSPVVTVYPGGVLGPHDPYRGENSERLRWVARGMFPLYPRGGMHMVDVRTVGQVVSAVMERGRGPRRYVVPGTHMTAELLYSTLSAVQGRRRPFLTPPTPLLRTMTRQMDLVQRRLPGRMHMPTDPEGVEYMCRDCRLDDEPARTELGVEPVPFEQSVRDTVAWLVEAGRLPRRFAPKETTGA